MKKKLLAILCLTIAITVTGCGQSSANSAAEKEIAELEDEIEGLKEENSELKAKLYDYENSQSEQTKESSELDGFVAETSGVCGADLTWEYGNGILRILGTGEMSDFCYDNRPWEDIIDKINHVYIEEGCTYVGEDAFNNIKVLSKIVLPSSVSKVGSGVFKECNNLKIIEWGSDEYKIDGQDILDIENKICSDGHEAEGMWGIWRISPAAEAPAAPWFLLL